MNVSVMNGSVIKRNRAKEAQFRISHPLQFLFLNDVV